MKLSDRIKLAWRCLRHGKPQVRITGEVTIDDNIDFGGDVSLAVMPGAKVRFTHCCKLHDVRQYGGHIEMQWCGCSAHFPDVSVFKGKMEFPPRTDVGMIDLGKVDWDGMALARESTPPTSPE